MTSKFYVSQSITYKDFKDTLAKESLNLFRYSLNTRLYKVNGNGRQ